MAMMISSSCMPRRWYWIFFIAILLFATVIRLWHLGQLPVSLYWDEAAMYVDVKSVIETGKDMHGRPWYQLIYPSYGDYKLPAYIWSATASSKVFGLSEFSLRFPSAVAGTLTVLVAGLLTRTLLQQATRTKYTAKFLDNAQLLTMLVVASAPWSVQFSRTAFEGHLGQLLLATSILFAVIGLRKTQRWLFWLSPIIGALATYSYFSVRFVWIAVYPLVCAVVIWQQCLDGRLQAHRFQSQLRKIWRVGLKVLLGLALFGLLLLPLLRSPLAKDTDRFRLGTASVLNNDGLVHQSNLYRALAGNTPIDRVIFNKYWLTLHELLRNYSDNTSPNFLFVSGDPNLRHGTGQTGLFLLVLAPLFITGFAVLYKRHFWLATFLVGWWILALLPASVPENTPHALRSLNALVPLAITIGFGTTWCWQRTRRTSLKFLLVGIWGLCFVWYWWFYTTIYPATSADDWQSGYKPLAQELTAALSQGKTAYLIPFDDRFYLWIMAYGEHRGQDFQRWQSDDYKFATTKSDQNFERVFFSAPDDIELLKAVQEGKQPLLIGKREAITERCSQSQTFTCTVEEVYDEVMKPKFAIATLTPKSL